MGLMLTPMHKLLPAMPLLVLALRSMMATNVRVNQKLISLPNGVNAPRWVTPGTRSPVPLLSRLPLLPSLLSLALSSETFDRLTNDAIHGISYLCRTLHFVIEAVTAP